MFVAGRDWAKKDKVEVLLGSCIVLFGVLYCTFLFLFLSDFVVFWFIFFWWFHECC